MADSPMADNTITKGAGNLLSKKYGPLPFGAWLVIVAGTAYFARRLIKGQQAANDAASQQATGTDLGPVGGVPFGSGALNGATTNSNNTPVTPPTEVDNQGWLRRAAEKLTASGMWNPIDIQRALQAYITGQALDSKQTAIVNQAIKVEGQPPVPIVPGGSTGNHGNPTLSGLVQRAGHAGVFAQYSDGTLRWITNQAEYASILQGNPGLHTTTLPGNDPAFNSADYGGQAGFMNYLRIENNLAKHYPNRYNPLPYPTATR